MKKSESRCYVYEEDVFRGTAGTDSSDNCRREDWTPATGKFKCWLVPLLGGMASLSQRMRNWAPFNPIILSHKGTIDCQLDP